jgi:Pvc16 N-terminal domain
VCGRSWRCILRAMATTVRVPLNTMLADLDETLRTLLKRDLGTHGFDGVEVVFDAPAKEWSASLSSPTVNLFLYDVRESQENRVVEWEARREEGLARDVRPPLRVDASYSATAWTRAVEDEHRLLSQVLAVLYAYPALPEDVLTGALSNGSQRFPLRTRVGQRRAEGKADFWTAVGGQYKASVDYVVTLSCESGTVAERGPEVRTQTVRVHSRNGSKAQLQETHRLGGQARTKSGAGAAGAWVVLRETGRWTVADDAGRFSFDGLPSGTYHCLARGADGQEADAEVTLPGASADLVLGGGGRARAKRGR